MSLKRVTIGDVCLVGDGSHAKIKRNDNGVMYLTSKNFKENGLDLSKLDYISEEDYKKYFKEDSKALTKPIENDVLMSIIGTMGMPYIVKEEDEFGLSSSVAIIRANKEVLPKYMYYWMLSPQFQQAVMSFKSGVAQGFLSLDTIRKLPLVFPIVEIQKRIVDVITKYDDLIENNLKRIKLLEETVESIYKEWFVNLRFPGYEERKDINSLPQSWSKSKLGDVIKIIKGKKPHQINNIKTEKSLLYLLVEVLERKDEHYTEDQNVPLAEENEVLMIMDGSRSGTIFKSMIGAVGSTMSILRVTSNKIDSEYLYHFLKSKENEIKHNNTGAAIPHANKNFINNLEINIPEKEVRDKFHKIALNITSQINNLNEQIKKLKEARDILLPKLINGEIEV